MAYSLRVYNVTNSGASLGTLSSAVFARAWSDDIRVPGALTFTVPISATADRALLEPLRVIRVHDGTSDVLAFVVRDEPAELVVDENSGRPAVQYQCDHHLSRLGYGRGGITLYPYEGLDGLQQSPRWFGPMGFDFIERTGIPEPTTGGALTRENWQDPRAERFVFTNRALYRRFLTGSPADAGPARMWLTSAQWTDVRVWFDGVELHTLSSGVGDRSIRMLDLPYDGEDHVIFFDCEGTPPTGAQNSLGWTWAKITADDNGEYNDWGQMEGRLFTTFNSTTYEGPTPPSEPFWQAWENYADGDYPGANVGFVGDVGVTEAQARGLLSGVTTDFDEVTDSGGVAWEHEFARAIRSQRFGYVLDSLNGYGCEPDLTPANVFRIHQQRGTDRTATITVTSPSALSATGRGPVATRYLFETEGGFGEAIDTASETALGTQMEDYVSLGEDVHPHTAASAITRQLSEDSATRNELEVTLPDDLVPYGDVFPGDIVNCQSDADGTVSAVRIMALRTELTDDTGRGVHYAELGPT